MAISVLIWLIVWVLIVIGIVLGLLWLLAWIAHPNQMNMPANLHKILRVIIVVIAVLVVVSWFIGYLPPPPGWRTAAEGWGGGPMLWIT